MGISIRRATANDLDLISDFLDEHLRKDWFMPKARIIAALSAKRSQCLLAYADDKLVGVALAGGRRTTLYNLLVHPHYRTQGIGGLLVKQIDPMRIRAKTDMSSGDPSEFYRKLGYREFHRDATRNHITVFERLPKVGEQISLDHYLHFGDIINSTTSTLRSDTSGATMHRSGRRLTQRGSTRISATRRRRLRKFTGLAPTAVLDANVFIGLHQRLTPAHPLAQLTRRAFTGQVHICVTPELPTELGRDGNEARRVFQIGELAKFPVAPAVEELRLQLTVDKLLSLIFPNAKPSSKHMENKLSDCRQLAYAIEGNAEYFVTYDSDLLRKGLSLRVKFGIVIVTPETLLQSLEFQPRTKDVGALVRPSLDIRVGSKADLVRVWDAIIDSGENRTFFEDRVVFDANTTLKIVEVDNDLAAVLILSNSNRDEVNLRLLWVVPKYRRRGLGQHLLQHAINIVTSERCPKLAAMVPAGTDQVPVFLSKFGFRLEASIPHPSLERVEHIFARYLLYRCIRPATWVRFTHEFMSSILVMQPADQPNTWLPLLPTGVPLNQVRLESDFIRGGTALKLFDSVSHRLVAAWDTYQLEAEFAPLQLAFPDRQAVVVPIRRQWAEALFEYADPQLRLIQSKDKRKLRADNVYYKAGRDNGHISRGTPILWYVSQDSNGFPGGLVACAKAIDSEIGPAEELFQKYGDLGIYSKDDVIRAARGSGGKVQAIRFGQVEAFSSLVRIADIQRLLGFRSMPITARAIPYDAYLDVRKFAGLGDFRGGTNVRSN